MRLALILYLFTITLVTHGQVSGNQVFSGKDYTQNNNTAKQSRLNKLYLNDSSFIVEARVLKNIQADTYVAVFGLNQEAVTISNANAKVNERVRNFIKNIKKSGVKESDIYTDILTQTRVYDFKKVDYHYEEYVKGFELSRNIIFKYSKPEQLEKFIIAAAQDSIFDLVKVDYYINDVSKVYEDLFMIAKEVIHKKKQMYVDLTNAKLEPTAQIYSENFESYYPSDLYKSYKAFTQNYYENYYWLQEKQTKRLHKFQTFYYDKIDYTNFDKIINPVIIEPAIQVILTIQVKYNLVN